MIGLIYAVASYLLSIVILGVAGRRQPSRPVPTLPKAFFYAVLALVLARQFYLSLHVLHGEPSFDEIYFGRVYVNAILSRTPIYGGFNQGVMAALFGGWYSLVGPWIESGRFFASLLGVAGAMLYVIVIEREFDRNLAILAGAFLCLGTYFGLFASLSLEVVAVFCAPPFFFLLYRTHKCLAGAALAASFFTYPGVVLAWVAFGIAGLLIYRREFLRAFRPLAPGFLLVFTLGAVLHRFVYTNPAGPALVNAGFLQGGGFLATRVPALLQSLSVNLHDLCLGGNSDYVFLLPHATFLEQAIWGFFVLGAVEAWRRGDRRHRVLLLTAFLIVFANFAVAYRPGMRRAVGALLPAYFLCALGAEWVCTVWPRGWSRPALGGALAVLLLGNAFYLLPTELTPLALRLGHSVPDAQLFGALARGEVYLNEAEYDPLSRLAPLASYELWHRFAPQALAGELRFAAPGAIPASTPCAYAFTWIRPGAPTPPPGYVEQERATVAPGGTGPLYRLSYVRGGLAAPAECRF